MRFDERFLDEVKSRLRLSDVIGRTVKLRRQGREYVGLSPFSKEKSPSFFVNDDKGFFHDFSSGKHGDLISFLQETERLSFPEAVERLAAEAGVPLPAIDPRAAEAEQKRQGLGDWLEQAAAWFEAELRRPVGRAARGYLDARGLPEAERARFRIGYAPAGRTALKDHLIAKGARPAALVEAGLLIAPDMDKPGDGAAPYDRFRDRIIFPILDGRGRVISFGGRALDPEAKAKYLNGPETELFHKGSTLYGLPEARRLLHTASPSGAGEDATLVVVEGYMDVIACQRAGIAAAAPLGTALTEEQMAALWRLHPEPTLAFDADAAGRRAAGRVIERALPLLKPGRSFRFAQITGGKDPDEVLREQGAKALRDQLAQTRPFAHVLFEREVEAAQPLDTPERKTALKVNLRRLAATIADGDLAQSYKAELLQRFETLWPDPQAAYTASDYGHVLSRHGWDKRRAGHADSLLRNYPGGVTNEGRAQRLALSVSLRPVAAALAQGFLNHPELIEEQFETLEVQGFGDPGLSEIAKEIIRFRLASGSLDSQGLRRHLASHGFDPVLKEIARAAELYRASFLDPDLSLDQVRGPWARVLSRLVEVAALERALNEAKAELESDLDAFREVQELKSARDAVEREIRSGTEWMDEASPGMGVTHH